MNTEQLYFLHIPKTAGGTVVHMLDDRFPYDEIEPALLLSDLLSAPDPQARVHGARFVRGHFGSLVLPWLRPSAFVFTFLRDPVARTRSQLQHMRRNPEIGYWLPGDRFPTEVDLDDFLDHPDAGRAIGDIQTRHLTLEWPLDGFAAHWDHHVPQLGDSARLGLAVGRLDSMDMVGIQERFADSLMLLSYRLGLRLADAVTSYNVAPDAGPTEGTVHRRLASFNALDAHVYAHGYARFERDFAEMRSDLERRFPELAGQPGLQLDAHLRAVQAGRPVTNQGSQVCRYDFAQPLDGENWYPREWHDGTAFRWTGPGSPSTLRLSYTTRVASTVEIDSLGAPSIEALESLAVSINDIPIELRREDGRFGPRFVGRIAAEALAQERQCLHFSVGTPVEVAPGRRLGISVSRVVLAPLPG